MIDGWHECNDGTIINWNEVFNLCDVRGVRNLLGNVEPTVKTTIANAIKQQKNI